MQDIQSTGFCAVLMPPARTFNVDKPAKTGLLGKISETNAYRGTQETHSIQGVIHLFLPGSQIEDAALSLVLKGRLAKYVLNLPVDTAHFLLCPRFDFVVELLIYSQKK